MLTKIEFPSPNFAPRHSLINCIVIHDTASKTAKAALEWFANKEAKVSSHYLIDKNGNIYQCVAEDKVAWHAGNSELWQVGNVNDYSIGIELVDDNDNDSYPEEQIESLLDLATELIVKYKIQLNRIVGHEHIAIPRGRKTDPGRDFDWYAFLNVLGTRAIDAELREGK